MYRAIILIRKTKKRHTIQRSSHLVSKKYIITINNCIHTYICYYKSNILHDDNVFITLKCKFYIYLYSYLQNLKTSICIYLLLGNKKALHLMCLLHQFRLYKILFQDQCFTTVQGKDKL